jgi:hypothetical protein
MEHQRIVQLIHTNGQRRVAIVREPELVLVRYFSSVYSLAVEALERNISLRKLLDELALDGHLSYDDVYKGTAAWRLLPALDHPQDPRFCMVSGTGLTHKASAQNRNKMHNAQASGELTDSMKIYQWGEEGGKPDAGLIGTQPEWFYKGNGSILKAHNEELLVPNYGDDGGEEPELAALYINDKEGNPCRIGFATANEFSDHIMEKKNYLYLAPSKIRTCSLGPELVLISEVTELTGRVAVHRAGEVLWEKAIKTGEVNMAHSLENLEYHHFKYTNHRLPLDLHVHFLGADAFSFGEDIQLADGDEMTVQWDTLGRPLRNILRIDPSIEALVPVRQLG